MAAWVAGVFSVLVGLTMISGRLSMRAEDPLKSPQLAELKEKLRLNPADEQAKQRIRQLDLQLRQLYFRQLSRMDSGVYLLLGGVAVFILTVKLGARSQRRLPMPQPRPDAPDQSARSSARARWSVAASGAAIGGLLFILTLGLSAALPKRMAEAEKTLGAGDATGPGELQPTDQPSASDAASPQELMQNWPGFRGPGGCGVSPLTNVPAAWDPQTGAGIAWKVPSPTSGFGSPIVWGDRVFLSGGDARQREVVCLNSTNGQELWRQPVANVPGATAQPAEVPESTGYAAATMATDGRRVYVFFANGDCAAFTLEGKPVWSKSFGPLKNPYGHATSLTTWRDRLIVQLDQGDSDRQQVQALCAGRAHRPDRLAAPAQNGGVLGDAHRHRGCRQGAGHHSGRPLRHRLLRHGWHRALAARGTQRGNHALAGLRRRPADSSPAPPRSSWRFARTGQGDVTKTHVVWTCEDNVPDVTSPLSNGDLVFMLTTAGMLTCLDAKDGKKQWDHDYDMEFHASPSVAAGRLYLFSQKGTALVVEAAREFKELLRTEMGDAFHASPAFAPDRIFLRGVTNVWCLGAAAQKDKAAGQP